MGVVLEFKKPGQKKKDAQEKSAADASVVEQLKVPQRAKYKGKKQLRDTTAAAVVGEVEAPVAVEGGQFTGAALGKLRERLLGTSTTSHTGFYTTFRMFANEGHGYKDPDDPEEVPVELARINRKPLGYILPSGRFSTDVQTDRIVVKTWNRKKPVGMKEGLTSDLPFKGPGDIDREQAAIQQAFLHLIEVGEIPRRAIQMGADGRPYVQVQIEGESCVYTLLPEGTVKFQ